MMSIIKLYIVGLLNKATDKYHNDDEIITLLQQIKKCNRPIYVTKHQTCPPALSFANTPPPTSHYKPSLTTPSHYLGST